MATIYKVAAAAVLIRRPGLDKLFERDEVLPEDTPADDIKRLLAKKLIAKAEAE